MTTEEVLQKCNILYEDNGDRFTACCPYHSEKTPSFSIYKEGGNWICFGCGKKGKLSQLLHDLTGESLQYKAQYKVFNEDVKTKSLRYIDYQIDGQLLNVFDNKQVLEYCWSIGFTDKFIEEFDIKYFKKVAFVFDESEPKYYYNRIIIPCKFDNKIYNYECRDFTNKSSKKVLYPRKAENDFLFNFDNINVDEELIVVEGIKGLAKVWSYYSKNVVSTFGSLLKDFQKEQLLKCKKIIRMPDNDENKIDDVTGEPRNNILKTIKEMDSFYPDEYDIVYIPYKGFDPNNLTISQLQEVFRNRKQSVDYLIDMYF